MTQLPPAPELSPADAADLNAACAICGGMAEDVALGLYGGDPGRVVAIVGMVRAGVSARVALASAGVVHGPTGNG